MLPTFICVGPGRAGTTWLYEALGEHPEVCMAAGIKETEFFDLNHERGRGWYERFFADCGAAKARGEITNRYIFDPRVPARIAELVPDCRIIVCLRNPYQRIQSNYAFKLREGNLACDFATALDRMPALIEENDYASLARPYVETFGRANVFFMVYDDLAGRPDHLFGELCRFLGVRDDFEPSLLREQVNSAVRPRHPLLGFAAKRAARGLRALGMHRLLTALKRSDRVKGALYRRYDYKADRLMTPEIRARLEAVFEPQIRDLERLIGRDLSAWREAT